MTKEQRKRIRYRTNFKALLRDGVGDNQGQAKVRNLSSSGLQIECSHEVMAMLTPNTQRPDPLIPVSIHVYFQVPTSRQSRADIDLECLVIYARRQAQDRYLIGAEFSRFEHQCEEDLEDYMNHFGERA
ncbi:MAG: PilZ domain-containing protein [Cellvibrionaceae bacterium]